MMNHKISASKNHGKTQKMLQQSPRSPLKVKDHNVSSSSSSSSSSFSSSTISDSATTTTSISIEAPRGCLRFFLSHHSSNVSKNAIHRKPRCYMSDTTPKSALNVKHLKGKLTCNGGNPVKTQNNLQNPEKPTSRNVQRLKKNPPPPCLYPWKSGSKSKLSVASENKVCENAANFTPVNKLGHGSHLGSFDSYSKAVKLSEKDPNSSDTSSPIPPIQASVSPEIQGGSTSVVKATPTTCYAAGHVLSGVSDKRKCRPRGLLTIGDHDLFGSSKTKVFRSEDENFIGTLNKPRFSLVPSPEEASMHWILSPCDERRSSEKDDEEEDKDRVRLNKHELLMPLKSLNSPSSSLGFSSELGSKSSSTVTGSDATTVSHGSRSRSSDFQGIVWPSFDHLVRSPSPSSPVCVLGSKVKVSSKQEIHTYNQEKETTPCSDYSIGSGNVIQTPRSNSSSQNFGFSHMSRDEISRLWFESELNSVAEVLRRVSLSPECELPILDSPRMSFEFNPLIKPDNSIDFANFQKSMDSQTSPGIPGTLLHSLPESDVRISWREGLASRMFEMDELDCCRCFSDEEDDVGADNDPSESCSCPEVVDADSNECNPTNQRNEVRFPSEEISPSLELSNGDGHSDAANDFSWRVCENQLFQV